MRNEPQTASQEVERLLEAYSRQPDLGIRDRLVEAHLYIAEIIARKFSGRGVDYDDLFQVAAMALVKAIDRFDYSRGIKFASFVTPSMVGEVKNYFRDKSRVIRLPRRGATLMREIEMKKEEMAQQLHRMPKSDELAETMGIPEDMILEALEMASGAGTVSLDSMPSDEEETAPLERFLGVNEEGYADFERTDSIRRAMIHLDDRQREIIQMRYFENLSQREIAVKLDISQMTVSREERKALEIMKKQI